MNVSLRYKMEKKLTPQEIVAQRRIALYNIKAKNTGFTDYFDKNVKKEKQLKNEREKLLTILRNDKLIKDENKLLKPGDKENEDRD